jgi:hypothetical protein
MQNKGRRIYEDPGKFICGCGFRNNKFLPVSRKQCREYLTGILVILPSNVKKRVSLENPFAILGRPLFLLGSSLGTHKRGLLLLILPFLIQKCNFSLFLLAQQSQFCFGLGKMKADPHYRDRMRVQCA